MKIWIDDIRPAPKGYVWCKSVNKAKSTIVKFENENNFFASDDCLFKMEPLPLELIDIDHDAGDYASQGGDYIKLLDWLEATNRNYPIRIHSANPVGVANMRRIIQRNGWTEVKLMDLKDAEVKTSKFLQLKEKLDKELINNQVMYAPGLGNNYQDNRKEMDLRSLHNAFNELCDLLHELVCKES